MKENNENRGRYDSAYKALFSNPRIFYQLIRGFVEEEFVLELKPEHFKQLENRSFISPEFLEREADLIYRISLDEQDVYFYILMEFQSTPDKRMPVRLFSYLLLFYEQMIKHSQKGKLPAVFPIVLYNGIKPWNIPLNIRDLIDGGIIPEEYLLRGSYYLLDENRVPEVRLTELHNLASAVIYYERHRRTDDMKSALMQMMNLLKNEDFREIQQVILWAFRITGKTFNEEDISKLRTLQEGREYMDAVTSQWEINIRKQALQEGEKIGLQKGELKGEQKGEQKGRKEEKILIARSMLKEGFDSKTISKITGLNIEEIENLY